MSSPSRLDPGRIFPVEYNAGQLQAGDRVAVTYSDRGGKVVAETITRLDATHQ